MTTQFVLSPEVTARGGLGPRIRDNRWSESGGNHHTFSAMVRAGRDVVVDGRDIGTPVVFPMRI
jgi:hypothetical protein